MQELTEVYLGKVSDARISRDNKDVGKVLQYLKKISPFIEDNSSIGSIATNVIVNEVGKMERKDSLNTV